MQFLFSTPLNEKVEKINNTRCYAISKIFRTIKIYLVLIEIDNSRNNAILVVTLTLRSMVVGLIGHCISKGIAYPPGTRVYRG